MNLNDVLVVGAGPVGLAVAAELARYGVRVRVIDKAAAASDKSKALVLWSRTLELLDRAGCGDRFVACGIKAAAANITANGRRIAHLDMSAVDSPHPYALMLPQSETERLLAEHLATFGVAVERCVELSGFEPRSDCVEATLREVDGTESVAEFGWIIGCDGAHSTVRHGLGLPFAGETERSDWLLADVQIDGAAAPRFDEVNIFWHAAGVLALFPITPGRFRVIADLGLPPGADDEAALGLAEAQAVVDERGPSGLRLHDPVWLTRFRINERKVAHYREGRVFLAGDAAHVHSPAGGQGMNTGIQDAVNLAWKLVLAVRGQAADDTLLDSYSAERSGVGDLVLKNASRLTHVAVLRNPLGQVLRNNLVALLSHLPPVQQRLATTMTELDIAYPDSALNQVARGAHSVRGGPKPGERAPLDATLGRRIGAGRDPRFMLIGAEDSSGGRVPEPLARFASLIELAPPLDPATARKYALPESGLWLIRPDGYVGLHAPADGGHLVAEYLAKLFVPDRDA